MRWYRLTLGEGAGKLVFDSKEQLKKGAPINIAFSITNYKGQGDVTNFIKIYNIPPSLQQKILEYAPLYETEENENGIPCQVLSKQGSPIKLEVGMQDDTIYSKNLNYTKVAEKTLLSSSIQNIVGNYSVLDNWIGFTTFGALNNQKSGQISIKPNENIKAPIEQALQEILGGDFKFKWDTKASNLINSKQQTTQINYEKFLDLKQALKREFNIQVYINNLDNSVHLGNNVKGNDKVINTGDMLSQPQVLSYGIKDPDTGETKTLSSLVTVLRPDLSIDDIVQIKGKTLGAMSGVWSEQSYLPPTGLNVFGAGKYKIYGVQHIGEFYGESVDSWSTQLQLVPIS